MISGVDRPVLLDIARMAAARVAIDRLTFVVALLLFIESVLTLAVFPDASINPLRLVAATIGLLLITAQIALVRPGLERLSRNENVRSKDSQGDRCHSMLCGSASLWFKAQASSLRRRPAWFARSRERSSIFLNRVRFLPNLST